MLNVANNFLKALPENIGSLTNLHSLSINGNKSITRLPKSIFSVQKLTTLELDKDNFVYPPSNVIENGTAAVLEYICNGMYKMYLFSCNTFYFFIRALIKCPNKIKFQISRHWTGLLPK